MYVGVEPSWMFSQRDIVRCTRFMPVFLTGGIAMKFYVSLSHHFTELRMRKPYQEAML
jgi:pantothenate kinase